MAAEPADESPAQRNQIVTAALLWAYHFVAGRYDEAAPMAALLVAQPRPAVRFQGFVAQAFTEYFRGNVAGASLALAGIESPPSRLAGELDDSLPTDALVFYHVIQRQVLWYLGFPEESEQHAVLAREAAADLPEEGGTNLTPPYRAVFRDFNLAGVFAFDAFAAALQEDWPGAREAALRERHVVARHEATTGAETAFGNYDGVARAYDCLAAGRLGAPLPATAASFEEIVGEYVGEGAAGSTVLDCFLADLRLALGDTGACERIVVRGLEDARRRGERFFESDLIALRGRMRFPTDPEGARRDFVEALHQAGARSSPPLRLRAARAWALADPIAGRDAVAALLDECAERVTPSERNASIALLRGS